MKLTGYLRIEIDHNFSKAHSIVTSSILPVVEQYAEQSRQVWEGSKVSIDTRVVLETVWMQANDVQSSFGSNFSNPAPMSLYGAMKTNLKAKADSIPP